MNIGKEPVSRADYNMQLQYWAKSQEVQMQSLHELRVKQERTLQLCLNALYTMEALLKFKTLPKSARKMIEMEMERSGRSGLHQIEAKYGK